MKRCTKCHTEKLETEYFLRDKKSGRLHAQCKQCYQAHRQTYYAQHYAKYRAAYLTRAKQRRELLRAEYRQNMLEYLSGKFCAECGENDVRVLELDHINSSTKAFSISQAVRLGYSWSDVELELKKCQILCANCHKKRTAEQFHWYKS